MSEFIRNDPIATRYAMLYEFAKGKPIFESYQELCKTLKDDSFDYQEFEFWFMKFARKEFDVNYDRSSDPKCRSFSQLPVDIFKILGDYLSLDDRYNLRTVSKNIQKNVYSWKPNVVDLIFKKGMSDQERLKYAYLLKNPKLDLQSLELLTVSEDKRSSELVVSVLKQVEHVVRVRKFRIAVTLSDAALIISKFDPRVLDDLEIRLKDGYIKNLDTILELEQIKGLKYFYILTKLDTHRFPLHCFLTSPVFSIVYDEATDLKPIVVFIRKLLKNSNNLKNCYFFFRNERFRESYLRKSFSRMGTSVPVFRNYRHIPIPGSTDVYELEFSDRDISIERKKKEEVDYGSSSDSYDSDT